MANESEMKLFHGVIGPGASVKFRVDPAQGLQVEGVVPILLRIDPSYAGNFRLVSVVGADSETCDLLVDLPVAGQESFKLRPYNFPKGDCLVVWIENVSTVPADFRGSLFVLSSSVDEVREPDPEGGILSRCWSWFRDGLEAAVTRAAMRSEVEPSLVGDARPGQPDTVIRSIRRLCSDFVDAAEIPLLAASLYWRDLAGLAVGSPKAEAGEVATMGLLPVTLGPGEEAWMESSSPYWVRPHKLRFAQGYQANILSVVVGKDELLPSACPVSGVIATTVEGMYLGRLVKAAGPGRSIRILVANPTASEIVVSGALDCEIFLRDPDQG